LNELRRPLPSSLAHFDNRWRNVHLRKPAKRRGRSKASNMMRDVCFIVVLMMYIEDFQILPTRQRFGTRDGHHCGCSLLALACKELGLKAGGEEGLRKVWTRLAPRIVPGTPAEALLPVLREDLQHQTHRVRN
jgi:hypothetical protein